MHHSGTQGPLLGALCALSFVVHVWAPQAWAEDVAEDHGSRAAREKKGMELGTSYSAGLFGGVHTQTKEAGFMVDFDIEESLERGGQRLRGGLGYIYDPFSTKTFNFSEDDELSPERRLVQKIHEFEGSADWRQTWTKKFESTLAVKGGLDLPELDRDQNWEIRVLPEIRFGRIRGPFVELKGEGFLKKYPNYLIADRKIDQQGVETTGELGFSKSKVGALSAGYEVRFTDYLDARYDTQDENGVIGRAERSKTYLRHSPFLSVLYRPSSALRSKLSYKYETHDSRNYDRWVLGLDEAGASQRKFIEDYYDYKRHRFNLRVKSQPIDPLTVTLMGEYWVRGFETYEARDETNTWTGYLRSDNSAEFGLETSYQFAEIKRGNATHVLSAVGFVSYLRRRSNMEREVSMATNFDVTRVFVGIEASGL